LTIGKVRSDLYKAARLLGDVQALSRGPAAQHERTPALASFSQGRIGQDTPTAARKAAA